MTALKILPAILLASLPLFPAGLIWTSVNGAVLEDYSSPPMITPTVTLNSTGVAAAWRFATQPLAAPPRLRLIARLNCAMNAIPAFRTCGMIIYDGTRLEAFELVWDNSANSPGLQIETAANVNTQTAVLIGPTVNLVGAGPTLQIIDNGTKRTFYYWKNGGFQMFYQEPSGTFLTPTMGGFGGVEKGNAKGTFLSAMCMIWSNNIP